MISVFFESAAFGQKELNQGRQVLFSTKRGEKEVEIFWDRTAGLIQGRVCKGGRSLPIAICGMPKRRAEEEELPLVQKCLEASAIRVQGNRIEIWPRLLGGMDNGVRSGKLNVLISAHSSSGEAVKILRETFLEGRLNVLDPNPKVGENIQEAIRRKVEESDLVIFFVTKDYLESEDCMCQATLLRSLVLKQFGENTYRQKMYIIWDQEIVRLRSSTIKGSSYANECCQKWNKKIEEAVQFIADPDKDPEVKMKMMASYLWVLYAYRQELVPFIHNDVFEKHWLTLEKLVKEDFKSLEEKITALTLSKAEAESEKSLLPEICEYTPLLSTFTGREKLLRQMEENLRLTEKDKKIHKTKVIVLSGLGGVGKTQLAAKFMEDHLEHYNLVWTFNAESELMLQQGYGRLAQKLKLVRADEKTVPPEEILEMVNDWLQAPENHGWLLCFDNADSLEIIQSKNLPQHGGEILITSRPKTHWENFYPVIGVQEFEREESNDLLKKIIPEGKQEGQEQLNTLAEELGDFPLAVDQAGSYIKSNEIGLTTSGYVQLFRETKTRLAIWKEDKELAVHKPYPATVATTWEITMSYIGKTFPNAAKALNLCAFLNANGIPLKWLKDWWTEQTPAKDFQLRQELNNLIKPLIDFSLFYWEKPQVLLRIHRLVQLVTQDNLKKEERSNVIREGLGLVVEKFESYDHKNPETWEIGKECLPHAVSVTGHILKEKGFLENTDLKEILSTELNPEITDEKRANFYKEIFLASEQGKTTLLFYQMATYSLRQGNAFEAKAYYTQALKMTKAFLGESHPSVADTLNNLGAAWSSLGEKKKAIEYYTQALEMKKSFLGESHPSFAETLHNLGTAWSDLGKNKKAIEYYEKALEMKKAFLGESHPSVADTLNNLGNAWSDLGKNKKAIEYYEKALEMKKSFLGESHPSVAETLNNLGTAWSDLGEKKKAIEYYEKALEMKKAFLGESHPSVADTLNNLGNAWSSLGEKKKAIEYYEKALEMKKAFLGESHPDVANTLHNLGAAWRSLGEKKQAIEYFEKALEMKKAFLGESHPSVADTLNNLGLAWSDLGEKKKAIEYYEKALKMKKAFLGESHPSVAETLNNLGTAWSDLGEKKKAIEYYEKALEMKKAFLGESHPSVAETLNNLGTAWSDLGEKKKAIEYYEQALKMKKAFLGESHPSVAETLNNLGNAWSDLGEKKKAIEYYTQAMEIFKAVFGDSHPDVASTLNNLGAAWRSLGENKKTIEYYEQALEMTKAFFGTHHPSVANTLHNLGLVWSDLGEKEKATQYFKQAYTLYQEFYGEDHPNTQIAKDSLNNAMLAMLAMLEQLFSNLSIEKKNNRSSEESFDLSAVDIHEQEMLLAQIHSEQPPTPLHSPEAPTFTVDELLEAALQEDHPDVLKYKESLDESLTKTNPIAPSENEEISFDEISEESLSDDDEPAIGVEILLESALLGHKPSYEELQKQADDQKDHDALYAMGILLERGVDTPSLEVEEDLGGAINCYKEAAAKGSLEAQYYLNQIGSFMMKASGKYEEVLDEDSNDYYEKVVLKRLEQPANERFAEMVRLEALLTKWEVILENVERKRGK